MYNDQLRLSTSFVIENFYTKITAPNKFGNRHKRRLNSLTVNSVFKI